jgi:SAM-dependent methyltransferase
MPQLRKTAMIFFMEFQRRVRPIAGSACLAFFLALGAIAVIAQQPARNPAGQNSAPQTEEKQERPTSKPYTGDLSVFEYEGRDKKLQIDRVMDILGIIPGKTVADIGSGSGWFSVRAARRVTQTGLVYAVDINPEAVRYIQQRAEREDIGNIEAILSKPADPLLPPQSIDAVLLLKTYHEIAEPVALLENLRKSLRPGARLGIIDRNGTAEDHGINQEIVVREASRAGYKLIGQYDFVKADREDYFLVFELRK